MLLGDYMSLPEQVKNLFNDPTSIKVLATRSPRGVLHVIPVGSMQAPDSNTVAFAAIFMREAHENLEAAMKTGEQVSVLAVKNDPTKNIFLGFQARCKVKSFDTVGPVYTVFKDRLEKLGFEIHGAWVLEPVKVINQTPGSDAGKKMT
jgi:hypothetical protein